MNLKPYLPNRATPNHWALTTKSAKGAVYPIRTLFQIVGGKTWSISLIKHGPPCKEEDWR